MERNKTEDIMIADSIRSCERYYSINEKFEKAFDFIKAAVAEGYAVGRYELEGSELFALVQEYETKLGSEGKFESHKKYIDIQFIISGCELMEVEDISRMTSSIPYNEEKDVEFYEERGDVTSFVCRGGQYAVFFPEDVHRPAMTYGDARTPVKKIVVKVKI